MTTTKMTKTITGIDKNGNNFSWADGIRHTYVPEPATSPRNVALRAFRARMAEVRASRKRVREISDASPFATRAAKGNRWINRKGL